ncbi:TetR/AcrR family transcriptional regulator [Ohtaekwangia koreensis]|uniref:Transcriptional regulator, TetR family n=1 Tax=Ohtaekwangia koreensis TaxID=688867 RepID=A0A1T5MHL5_9BACT|nr:TetR/AcrR family transcriptional regulator [Ohtaekwangia koreensis]SKC87379.1 transcriptional regulator, TetR family [Ohtaekwangia koreensis]
MRTRDESKELAIRQKAIQMIVEKGFDGLSMQKLAKAAGVSPATIYIYFKDRDDLILQLWIAEMKKMVDAILKNFDPNASFEEGLRVQWMNRAKFLIENPMSMHFMEQIKYSPYHNVALTKMDSNFIEMMGKFAHNAIKRKELVKLPFEIYWSVAFSPLYQLVKTHISGKGLHSNREKFVLDEKMMNMTLKLVIKALRP